MTMKDNIDVCCTDNSITFDNDDGKEENDYAENDRGGIAEDKDDNVLSLMINACNEMTRTARCRPLHVIVCCTQQSFVDDAGVGPLQQVDDNIDIVAGHRQLQCRASLLVHTVHLHSVRFQKV